MIMGIIHEGKVVGLVTQLEPITASDIDERPDLAFVACPCTGIDHIDTEYCAKKGIELIYLDADWKKKEGLKVTSTAEHTLSLMLQLAKLKRMQLSGKTLGVIGLGRIGGMVKTYAEGLGMRVIYNDPYVDGSTDLHKLLNSSDVVSIHIPLNKSTEGFINRYKISSMKNNTTIVNTSRCGIMDIDDLEIALREEFIGGYADDFLASHKFNYPNVIQTDHIGGNCIEAREETDRYIMCRVHEFIKRRFQ